MSEEKAVFLTIPKDDVGRAIGNIWSHMIDLMVEGAGGETRQASAKRIALDLLGETWGEFMPAPNPIIDPDDTDGCLEQTPDQIAGRKTC